MSYRRVSKTASELVGIVLLGGAIFSGNAMADDEKAKKEKCYGIAAKEMTEENCDSSVSNCSGHSIENAHPEEWIYVPAGMCDRLTGGSKEPKKE